MFRSNMSFKYIRMSKVFVAKLTIERFLSCMNSLMSFDASRRSKLFMTYIAFERPFPSVNSSVFNETTRMCEVFMAYIAFFYGLQNEMLFDYLNKKLHIIK